MNATDQVDCWYDYVVMVRNRSLRRIVARGSCGGRFFSFVALALSLPLLGCPSSSGLPPTVPEALLPFILSGFVTESVNSIDTIGGVLVEVTSGTHTGKTATTDSAGRYAISGLSGVLNIRASRAGFVATGATVNMSADVTLNISLVREAPTTPPAPEPTFTLSGTVTRAQNGSGPIAGATVEVQDGPRAGDLATTDTAGMYAIPGLSRGLTVRASGTGFMADEETVNLTADLVLDFSLLNEPNLTMCLSLVDQEVHITNLANEDLVLTDWILRGDNQADFVFVQDEACREESMEGFTLGAGMTVIITGGSDPAHDPPTHIAGYCSSVWNPAGDTARLFSPIDDLIVEAAGRMGSC